MTENLHHSFFSDGSLSNPGVPVFVGPQRIHAVVDVKRFQLRQPDAPIEFLQHLIQMVHDIVSPVVYVTGIQANAHMIAQIHLPNNFRQFLKAASDLAALSRHGLQEYGGLLFLPKHFVQGVGNHPNSILCALPHMAAGMKVIIISREKLHLLQILFHAHPCKFPNPLVLGAGIHGIGCVGHQFSESVLRHDFPKPCRILRISLFAFTPSRISCKKSKGIRLDLQCPLSHFFKTTCRGQMASNIYAHFLISLSNTLYISISDGIL